jgi:nifR3 family TIM-barrel protein
MARAAEALGAKSPDFIDINFGCPARKVVGGNGGSSVLKDMEQMRKIVKAVVDATPVPVTVKIRSGWDDNRNIHIEAGRIIEDCGAAAVTLHPRSKTQGFSGRADWNKIAELKESVKIPVIGNGDIFLPEDAARMFSETGCDAIMVGRGAVGNPWLFGRIKRFLVSRECLPEPKARERIELLIKHLDNTIAFYGLPGAIFKMRGQYPWYLRGLTGNSEVRSSLNRISSPFDIKETLIAYLSALETEPLNAAVL